MAKRKATKPSRPQAAAKRAPEKDAGDFERKASAIFQVPKDEIAPHVPAKKRAAKDKSDG